MPQNHGPDFEEPSVSINLRLPASLHAELRQRAQRETRSLNAQVVHLLRQGVGDETVAAR